MKKTVRELCEMIDNGELHYGQTTQRKFVYASIPAIIDNGKTTKAGKLINSILEKDIQLPALYFWHNTDTNDTNIHDGKQRVLSIYYFINRKGIDISTILDGKTYADFDSISPEYQEKLLNYTFEITERWGTKEEEEESFYLINKNALPLTDYECLSGMFYGNFLTGFENYIESMADEYDKIKKIGRGEQAYKFILAMFGFTPSKRSSGNNECEYKLNHALRPVRNIEFKPSSYKFDEFLICFNKLMTVMPGLVEDRAISIAKYIVLDNDNYKIDDICSYYKSSIKKNNDILSWDVKIHLTFIDAFVKEKLELDPQRFFTKDIKDKLYNKFGKCSCSGCKETSYSKLEVDHCTAWSKGGSTILDNAQLLCKEHNTSKGNKI